MNLIVKPSAQLKGSIRLPASKSYSIRAFMVAACGGRSTIIDPSNCDDARVAMRAAVALGVSVKPAGGLAPKWRVLPGVYRFPKKIDVNESGTVLRFLLPLVALQNKSVMITGRGSLRGRPNKFLTQALRKMGVQIRGSGPNESVPVLVKGGSIKGGTITINGSLSSQFISALLIMCPQLEEDTRILLSGKSIVSSDYIAMTIQVLKESGIHLKQINPRTFFIPGRQRFQGLKNFIVPSDYGLAAFHMAAAALLSSNITLKGYLTKKYIQADGYIVPLLRKMGARLQVTSQAIRLKGPHPLKGGNFSLKNCPDLVPIMSVLALFARGKTRLYNITHVRSKESDRISDVRKELLKIGARIEEQRDALTIFPQETYKKNCTLNPHNDHRLAMAFAVLGLKLGVRVKDIECSHKSYPDFVRDFKILGANARREKV